MEPSRTSLAIWPAFMPYAAALVASTLVTLGAVEAHAQTPERPVAEALAVDGGGECVEHTLLAQQVATWLERDTIDARIALSVRVLDRPGGDRVVSLTVLRDGQPIAEREFRHPPLRCIELRAALGLGIALAIDATLLESLGVVAPTPPRPPAARPRRVAPQPPAARRRPGPFPTVAAAVEGWVLGGVLPETAFAGYMGAEVGVAAPFAFRVGALGTTTVDTAIEPGSAAVSLVALRVDGCLSRAVWPAGRLGARACVGVAGGEVFAQGRGFHRSLATEILWAAAVAQLDVEIAILPAVALRLSAQGLLPLVRPRLEVARPSGDLAATRGFSRVGGGVGLGLAWRFR